MPETRTPSVNMADVAARAGVSIATVSRALRDVPGVSESTRRRIREIADDLAYVVSPEASGLSRRLTGRIAVVVPRIDVWFYSAMLAAVERTLHGAGLDVLVYQVDGRRERELFFERLPSRRKADAVILVALPVLAEEERRLDLLGVDVVVAGGRLRDLPHVQVDDHGVAARAVDHLVGLGHRRIAMIRTSDTDGTRWSADQLRTQGWRDSLDRHGLPAPEDHLVTEEMGVTAGAVGVERLLTLPRPPTAILAYSDEIAFGALHALHCRGVDVPGEMSVVGVDGHPLAELFDLTTVDQDVDRQGRLAAEKVLALLSDREVGCEDSIGTGTLVVRGTTGPPGD